MTVSASDVGGTCGITPGGAVGTSLAGGRGANSGGSGISAPGGEYSESKHSI